MMMMCKVVEMMSMDTMTGPCWLMTLYPRQSLIRVILSQTRIGSGMRWAVATGFTRRRIRSSIVVSGRLTRGRH